MYFDSYDQVESDTEDVLRNLNSELREFTVATLPPIRKCYLHAQDNDSDCGLFVLRLIECHLFHYAAF